MSTRANIVVKDAYGELWFYRHSDGYPEGALPLLNKFMDWLKSGKIRNNTGQAAGWLVLLGAIEYNTILGYEFNSPAYPGARPYGDLSTVSDPDNWKVGSVEPTEAQHGDIEWLYTIDLDAKELSYEAVQ